MNPHHIKNILYPTEVIEDRVNHLVEQMAEDCTAEDFVMIGILRGSFIFLADLVRDVYQHGIHPRIDFITLESYGSGTVSSGTVTVTKDISVDVRGADVLLVDDILDTGRTLNFARQHILDRGAARVRTCALLDKPSRRIAKIEADYIGFKVEDLFVVGYGLDYDSRYRELPYISSVTFTEP